MLSNTKGSNPSATGIDPSLIESSENISVAPQSTNLSTGEKFSVSLGKISKYFSDLKTVAFTGSYNDLINRPTSMTANGGNSATVNGHTVNSDVPSGAKFTDTVYTHPTGDGNKHIPANGTTNNGKYLKATGTQQTICSTR